MINQQVLKQLHKQAQRQSVRFPITTRPEIWQWALAFLGQIAQPITAQRSAKGLLTVQIPGIAPALDWLELPPEWKGPQFIRLQYLAGPSRYLAWEIHLQAQQISLQQLSVIPAQLAPQLDLIFTQQKQRFTEGLKQITAAFRQLEQIKAQQSAPSLNDVFSALSQIWKGVELSQLSHWTQLPTATVLEQLASQLYTQKITAQWLSYLPGEARSQAIDKWQDQLHFPRWQSKRPLILKHIYLCLFQDQPHPSFYLPLPSHSQNLLIFPKESQQTQIEGSLNSSLKWQSPAFQLEKTSLLKQSNSQILRLNLSLQAARPKTPLLTQQTDWFHQENHPLSLILGPNQTYRSAAELIAYQNCWPLLKNIWPEHKLSLQRALLLSVSSSAHFPLAWLHALETNCRELGGAIFEQSPQGALLLLPPHTLMPWLTFLAQSLQKMSHLLKTHIPYQIRLDRGEVDIYLHEQRFRLLGHALRLLNDMAPKMAAKTGFLVSAAVISDQKTQQALYQAAWQIFEFEPVREQALFFLQAPHDIQE